MNTVQFFTGLAAQFAMEILQSFLPIVAALIVARVMKILKIQDERLSLEVEGQLRDVLHAAMGRALQTSLINRGVNTITEEVIGDTIASLRETNPQTLNKLGASDEVLSRLILSKARLPGST